MPTPAPTPNLQPVELKPFVPAQDHALSKRFYQDIGFTLEWESEDLAALRCGPVAFLLQRFYVKEFADNLMLHLQVEDVDAWHRRIVDARIAQTYGVRVSAVERQPWGQRDFVLFDPSGVLWRVAQSAA